LKEVHPTEPNMSVIFVCRNRRDTETQTKLAMDGWHGMG